MSSSQTTMLTEYKMEEVRQHNRPSDAWVVVHGLVYNVTEYLHKHPGGLELLAEASGTDVTDIFYGIGHSEDAFNVLNDYKVGTLSSHPDVQHEAGQSPINPRTYVPLPLHAKTQITPNVYRFTFSLPNADDLINIPVGQHIGMRATIDGRTVSRSYTPVNKDDERGSLSFVIKIYPEGRFTQYLAALQVGDEVFFRGCVGLMHYQAGFGKQIGMVAGGTGITPLFPIINTICEDETDTSQIRLVYANRTEQDIIFRKELDALETCYPNKLQVYHLLTQPPKSWYLGAGRVNEEVFRRHLPTPGKGSRLLLCGTPVMVGEMIDLAARRGFERPGFIAKPTDEVFRF